MDSNQKPGLAIVTEIMLTNNVLFMIIISINIVIIIAMIITTHTKNVQSIVIPIPHSCSIAVFLGKNKLIT